MPGATVNNNASGTFTITNVSGNTWNENGSGNTLVFNDPDENTKLVIGANASVAKLTLGAAALTPKVTISQGATVANLVVETEGATINNQGTVKELSSTKEVAVEGTQPEKGVGSTKLQLAEGKTLNDLIFKVYGIKSGKSEAKLTFEQLKTAYSAASIEDLKAIAQLQIEGDGKDKVTSIEDQAQKLSEVEINTTAITLDGAGVLSIPSVYTQIFSETDFDVVKTTATDYNISVYYAGATTSADRLAKITINKANGVKFTAVK